jgi:hypothetical protein
MAAVSGRALVGAPEAMAGVQSTGQWGMTVARGKRARSSFTVDGPQPLDPEDLPDEVSAANSSLGSLFQTFIGLFHDLVNGWSTSATRLYPLHFISFPTLFGDNMIHDTSLGREGDVQTLSVSIQAAPLIDPVQREAFRRFSIDLATETNSFYAEAKDEDGYVWNGRKAKASPKRSWDPAYYQETSPGKWLGLPERPAWWTWFPAHYKDVVRPHLTGQIQEHTTGILRSFSETPVLEEQIRESPPAATTWLPKNLTVRAQLHKGPAPLAASIPERLTHMLVPITSA